MRERDHDYRYAYRAEHKVNDAYFRKHRKAEHCHRQNYGKRGAFHSFQEFERAVHYENYNAHADAHKQIGHPFVVADDVDDVRQCENYEERGEYYAERGYDSAEYAFAFGADKRSDVYGNRAGGAFGYCENVHQLVVSEPAAFVDDFVFYHRQHRVSAAKRKQPYFEKYGEHLETVCEFSGKSLFHGGHYILFCRD